MRRAESRASLGFAIFCTSELMFSITTETRNQVSLRQMLLYMKPSLKQRHSIWKQENQSLKQLRLLWIRKSSLETKTRDWNQECQIRSSSAAINRNLYGANQYRSKAEIITYILTYLQNSSNGSRHNRYATCWLVAQQSNEWQRCKFKMSKTWDFRKWA